MTHLLGFILVATFFASDSLADGDISIGNANFTEQMIKCFKQGKVYWGAGNKQCNKLPLNGVCPDNQWLVLDSERIDREDEMEPKCKKKPCSDGLYVYWAEIGNCMKMTTKNKCPEGNVIRNDMFGEGICSCREDPIHLPLNNSIGATKCYELYKKGPCPEGQVLVAQHVEKKAHIAVCKEDPCAEYRKKKRKNEVVALHAKTNQCYLLNSAGPCQGNDVFQVSAPSYLPGCSPPYVLAITSFIPQCASFSPDGPCNKPVQIEEETKDSLFFWHDKSKSSIRKHSH